MKNSAIAVFAHGSLHTSTQFSADDELSTLNFALLRAQFAYEHPVVLPHVSHFMQVPFRTSVKLKHSGQASPS